MQSTISGDFCEEFRSHFLVKFSDNVASFTWRLETLVGVNADCRAMWGHIDDLLSRGLYFMNVRPATY